MTKKKKKKGKIIVVDVRLKGFVDLVDPKASDLAKEREDDMSSLAARFSKRMRKRAISGQEETTSGFEVSGGKCLKRSGPNEEAQKSRGVITVDSQNEPPDALPTFEGASQDASREACASLEDGVPARGPPNAHGVVGKLHQR